MATLPSVESIQCFVAAARCLNFRAAARVVGLTPAALGKRIAQLEDQMGTRLFHRTTRKVELTQAGLTLLPTAQRLLVVAEDCIKAGRGEAELPHMDLNIGTRHELGLSWLVPMLPRLRREHPHITFHLYFGSGPDLELRTRSLEIDCAISSRKVQDPRIDALRIHNEAYVFVGAPDLMARTPLRGPQDAPALTLIDAHADTPLLRYFLDAQQGSEAWHFERVLRMGTIAAIRALVLAGDGVAVLPLYLVQPDLDAGRLVRLMPSLPLHSDHFRLLFRTDDPRRSLYETLAQTMRDEPLR